eukprot:Skav208612  [mRNA]  locus=scaffold248:45808:49789:- [translate_table: standard]
MLVHLYGFTTPDHLLDRFQERLPHLTQRLLAWAASLMATSVESLPATLGFEASSLNALSSLQPLPFSDKHRAALGEQLGVNWDFDVASSHWFYGSPNGMLPAQPPWMDPFQDGSDGLPPHVPWPRTFLVESEPISSWQPKLLYDLRHAALHSCLHECRPRTCHKGYLKRLGFCLLGYWHWRDVSAWTKPNTWQRCHGLPLRGESSVGTVPPHSGLLLQPRHHPFHTRFNYAILAVAKCNHDVSVLLRAPAESAAADRAAFSAVLASSARAASFYITAYISKTQPHMVGLWKLLEQGHARLQTELLHTRADSQLYNAKYIASRTITRMITACHRQVHKSLPEICHCLLGYPEAYTSHTFRALFLTNLLRKAQSVLPIPHISSPDPETSAWVRAASSASSDVSNAAPFSLSPMMQESDYLHREDEASAEDDFQCGDDLDADDFLLVSTPLLQRQYSTDWTSLRARVLQGTPPSSTAATALYASCFNALHVLLSAPAASCIASEQRDSLFLRPSRKNFAAMQRDVRDWRRTCEEDADEPMSSAPVVAPATGLPNPFPVMDAVLHMILFGSCTAAGGELNLKQAFFLVTFALGLHARWQHTRAPSTADAPRHALALLGGPGAGKTHILKEAISLQERFFPNSVQTCCYMNSAARLIKGRTLHAALRLPRGTWTARSRTLGADKEALLAAWRPIQLLCMDEISMIPATIFEQSSFRAEQVKDAPAQPWGGLSLILTGDFLQLLPVKAGSLAGDLPTSDHSPTAELSPAAAEQQLEAARGRKLWRDIDDCILLSVSHRASGALQSFLEAMRRGSIGPELWQRLLARCVRPGDTRPVEEKFWGPEACVGVLRHSARSIACLHRAMQLSRLSNQRLLLCLAVDSCRSNQAASISHPSLLNYLCHVTNLSDTENLPGVLFLWHGCILNLEDKISEQQGLVRGCRASLQSIILDPAEPLIDMSADLPPYILQYMPHGLICHVSETSFQQSVLLQVGDCFLQPMTRSWQHVPRAADFPALDATAASAFCDVTLTIARAQLPCTNPLACTATICRERLSPRCSPISHVLPECRVWRPQLYVLI